MTLKKGRGRMEGKTEGKGERGWSNSEKEKDGRKILKKKCGDGRPGLETSGGDYQYEKAERNGIAKNGMRRAKEPS